MSSFNTINPYTNEKIQKYSYSSQVEIDQALTSSHKCYSQWKQEGLKLRCDVLLKFAEAIETSLEELSLQATLEMGKPIQESRGEVKKCVIMMKYFVKNAPEFLKAKEIESPFDSSRFEVSSQGIIFGIMPWNFPYWQVLRFATPTLLVGNSILIKHAPNVQGCQNLIQKIWDQVIEEIDPKLTGVFQTLILENDSVPSIIQDQRIRGVSFTGSEKVGRIIGELAGKNLKKSVLELGGSDAYIVLEDADLDLAVEHCIKARFLNCGQSCVSAKRWLVQDSIYDEFKRKAIAKIEKLVVDNPQNDETVLGPMARVDLKEKLSAQVNDCLAAGATLAFGNLPDKTDRPEKNGEACWFRPILLEDVSEDSPANKDELFGPVAVLMKVKDTNHALEVANSTDYGLGGAIFTKDLELAEQMISVCDTGGMFINQMYQSHPALPFGGVKNSGLGRELSYLSLYEFANIKTIVR